MKRASLVALCAAILATAGVARAAEKGPLRVAVMDFTPAAPGEFDPLGAGLQSMITTDLVQAPNVILVERARIKDIQNELHLQQSGAVDKATAAKIGELSGATHLIVGSFTVAGGKMRLDARMFVVGSGEITLAEKMEGAQQSFFELEKQLVGKIVDGMGAKPSRKQKQEMQKPETTDFEAFAKYSQGLALFDQGNVDEAIAAMQGALARDPNFTLAATKLAELQRLAPALRELAKKAKEQVPPPAQCKPSSLITPPCTQPGQTPPSPTMFTSDGSRPFGVGVKAGGEEATCVTPCQLQLPPGPIQLSVTGPATYSKQLTVPPGPTAVVVSGKNKINLVAGSVLAGVTVAGIVLSIVFAEALNASTSPAQQYWPIPLALASGAAFPAIYYLMRMGRNDVRVMPVGGAR
jgi:TolB-like protein